MSEPTISSSSPLSDFGPAPLGSYPFKLRLMSSSLLVFYHHEIVITNLGATSLTKNSKLEPQVEGLLQFPPSRGLVHWLAPYPAAAAVEGAAWSD